MIHEPSFATKHVETKVRLHVYDFECSPTEITRILGLNPTETWLRGDKVLPVADNTLKENGWRLASPLHPINTPLDEHLDALSSLVLPRATAFSMLPTGSIVEISCVICSFTHRPVIHFSQEHVAAATSLKASIDVDVYDLSGQREEGYTPGLTTPY
jgi:hypothetical protein